MADTGGPCLPSPPLPEARLANGGHLVLPSATESSSLFSQAPAHGEGELFFSTGTHWIFQLFQIRQNFSNKVAVLCALHKEKRKKK